jgi:hypothetical protein
MNNSMIQAKYIALGWAALLLMGSVCSSSHGQEQEAEVKVQVEYALIFPDEKAPELVNAEENNPFVAVGKEEPREVQTSSEENLVTERLLSLRVVGASPRGDGYRVQFGDMILETGMVVPAFFPEQEIFLRVNTITDKEIEFVWLEKKKTGSSSRMLTVPIHIKPTVLYVLPGQGGQEKGGERAYGRHNAHANALVAASKVEAPKRGQVLEDPVVKGVEQGKVKGGSASAVRPKDSSDAIIDMFFNQGTGGVQGR